MDMNRTGKLIVSCCGAALVVAAVGVVWIGVQSKSGNTADRRAETSFVPAKLETVQGGGVPENAIAGPIPVASTGTGVPDSITENLVLQNGETFYGKGKAFFKDGDFASASRYLKAEVEQGPDRFDPTYLLGVSLWKESRLDEAIASLTSAASLDPKSAKARVNLGRVLNDAGRFEEALAAADEAITLDPESSPAHNVRGRALLNLHRRDEAIEAFEISIEKDSANAYARNNLGYALIQSGRFVEAVPCLEEAVRLRPEVGYFQNNLGMAYEHTTQNDKARTAYSKAVQAGGSDPAARNLARLGGPIDDDTVSETADEASN